jgi:hypothetical protein
VTLGFWRALLAASMVAALAFALRPLAPGQGPENWFTHADKLLHVALFAAFWWLAGRAGFAPALALAGALLGFGAAVEWAQAVLTATREASALDVLADAAGVAAGWIVTARHAAAASRGQPQENRR